MSLDFVMALNSTDRYAWFGQWREDLLRGSGRDPLINLRHHESRLLDLGVGDAEQFQLPYDAALKRILREQQEFRKASGVNVLCLVEEVLHWSDGESQFVSPIYLKEISFTIDKINNTVTLVANEVAFVNPFLEKLFQQRFDQDFVAWLESDSMPEHWQRERTALLGNFHYHRYVLLRDFDDYLQVSEIKATPLKHYLLETHPLQPREHTFETCGVFPLDPDQRRVFQRIASGENLVVEGPPGSGKSQVLANLLFDGAQGNRSVFLCSEKHTALQVVFNKLKCRGLDAFGLLVTNDSGAGEVIKSLKRTWSFLEKQSAVSKSNASMRVYEQKKAALVLKMERLGGLPRLDGLQYPLPFDLPVFPDWKHYEGYKDLLFTLHENALKIANLPLHESSIAYIKSFNFLDEVTLQLFLSELERQRSHLLKIREHLAAVAELKTPADLARLHRVSIHAQLLNQHLFRENPALFRSESAAAKKFKALHQKYEVSKKSLELYENQEGYKWQKPWSAHELMEARRTFSTKSFWQPTFRQWKKKFIAAYKPEVFTKELAIQAIDTCLSVHELKQKHQKHIEDLAKLGLLSPDVDIALVLHVQSRIALDDQGIRDTQSMYNPNELARILEVQSSITELNRFVNHNLSLDQNAELDMHFERILKESDFFIGQSALIHSLLEKEPLLPRFLPHVKDFGQLDNVVLWGAVYQFKNRNPELFHYRSSNLEHDIEWLIAEEDRDFEIQVQRFFDQKVHLFIQYHELMSAPTAKLDSAALDFRKKLKNGRSILIKEFNKSKQHKSLFDLITGDAGLWIKLLKPMVFINPTMISKVVPNVEHAIDLVLFDEASQIPFSHAIPTIFRASQIAVFGDSQQLSPSAYFLQGGARRADLLSESRHFLPADTLAYHYRSRHDALIQFSNRFFYNNQLRVLPAKTNTELDGVFCHFVSQGTYQEGKNTVEAEKLVRDLSNFWSKRSSDETVAVVAFSEKQLQAIEEVLAKQCGFNWNDALEIGTLTLTTLEKVQGDEFDFLFISLGYGRNPEGDFQLRFGPLNQEGGEKRLNVLFSRARRAIHFFHAVQVEDFGFSENLGVQALKNFLIMHSKTQKSESSYEAEYRIVDPFYKHNCIDELMTLKRHAALSGLKVRIVFTKDDLI